MASVVFRRLCWWKSCCNNLGERVNFILSAFKWEILRAVSDVQTTHFLQFSGCSTASTIPGFGPPIRVAYFRISGVSHINFLLLTPSTYCQPVITTRGSQNLHAPGCCWLPKSSVQFSKYVNASSMLVNSEVTEGVPGGIKFSFCHRELTVKCIWTSIFGPGFLG